MIVVHLMGGLGNQMFQYAAGRALALRRRTELLLDCSWYATSTDRAYRLGSFNIEESFATSDEVAKLRSLSRRPKSGPRRLLELVYPPAAKHFVLERQLGYDPSPMNRPGTVYLDGYWQSHRYFEDFDAVIRRDFVFRADPDEKNRQILTAIDESEAVAIHVRRGDYVRDPATNQTHGTCSVEYYSKAIERVAEMTKRPEFFVFSDDPDWCRKNLAVRFPTTYIANNVPGGECEDLRLMTHCRHFIIANSSFSWWGAFLSPFAGKVVIAPRKWFARADWHNPDLIPSDWIQL